MSVGNKAGTDRFLTAADHHALQWLIGQGVVSWCGTNGGNEPAGPGFGGDSWLVPRPHPGPAADHIDHALQLAVMMGPWAAVLRLR